MSNIFSRRRCLVLNKTWTPVGTVSLQRAVIMLFSVYKNGDPKARVIDSKTYQTLAWNDWAQIPLLPTDDFIQGSNARYKVPEIILLSKYEKLPQPKIHFSRRTLYRRDNMTCQYCGDRPGSSELTIDHVTPKSRGGGTTWENCVLACFKCNAHKANRTPAEAHMSLFTEPRKPRVHMFRYDTARPIKSWAAFLGEDYCLSEVEDDLEIVN